MAGSEYAARVVGGDAVDGLKDVGGGTPVFVAGNVGVLIDCAFPIPAIGVEIWSGVLMNPVCKDV